MNTLPIHNRRGQVTGYAVVDSEDARRLSIFTWRKHRGWQGYVHRRGEDGRTILLHHDVIGRPPAGLVTDHRNRNILDNRRSNLRHVLPGENGQNVSLYRTSTTGVRGVRRRGKKWVAEVRAHGVKHHVGTYETIDEAKSAVENARRTLLPYAEM